jgi:hypothetical protein
VRQIDGSARTSVLLNPIISRYLAVVIEKLSCWSRGRSHHLQLLSSHDLETLLHTCILTKPDVLFGGVFLIPT